MKKIFTQLFFVTTISVQLISCSHKDDSRTDIDLSKIDLDELQELNRTIDQLQYYGFIANPSDNKLIYAWPNQTDIIFNQRLDSLQNNAVFNGLVKCLEYAKTRDTKKNSTSIAEGKFEELLAPDFQKKYTEQVNLLAKGKTTIELSGIHFNLLYLLNYMQPVLEDLLQEDNVDEQSVLDAYVEARKKDMLYGIMLPLFKELRSQDLVTLLLKNNSERNEVTNLINKIETNGNFNFPASAKMYEDSIQYIRTYYSHLKDYYNEKNNLCSLFEEAIKNINVFNSNYIRDHGLVNLKITNAFEDIINRKKFEFATINTIDSDYVDISPRSFQNAFSIRLRFKTSAFERLNIDGKLLTEAEVFLVYTIHDGTGNTFPSKIDSLNQLKGSAEKVITEVSTGLTIQQLLMQKNTTTVKKSGNILFTCAKKDIHFDLSLPEVGIWSRYKYNSEKLKEINETLNCSSLLGIELEEIKFNTENWEPTLFFSWEPVGIFNDIRNSVPEFTDIKVYLSEIVPTRDENFRQALKRILITKVCQKIGSCADANNEEALARILHCKKIDFIKAFPISETNDVIKGQISLSKVDVPLLNAQKENVVLNFQLNYVNGKAAFNFEKLDLNLNTEALRSLIKSEAEKITINKKAGLSATVAGKVKEVISQHIPISSLYYDFEEQSLVVKIKGNSYKVNSKEQALELANTLVSNYLHSQDTKTELLKAAEKVGEKIAVATDITIPELLNCDEILKKEVTFWGIHFTIDALTDCKIDYAKFTASFKSVRLEGIYDRGRFSLTHVDVKALINELSNSIIDKIDFGKYVYITDARLENDELVVPIHLKIPSLNFDEMVTEIRIPSDGTVSISRDPILNAISKILTNYLKEHSNMIFLGEYAGLSVEFNSVDVLNREITLDARAELDMGISIKCQLRINFETGAVHCNILENPLGKIASILANGLLKNLLSGSNAIVLDEITPESIKRMQISGRVRLNIFGNIPLPEAGFTISKTGIDIDIRPKIVIPIVIPIVPPIVSFVYPSLELMIKQKTIRFSGDFAPGLEPADVKLFSFLIKVAANLDIYYGENFGKADFNGSLILISFIPLTNGPGHLSIPDKYASIESSTNGPLNDVIKFGMKTELGVNNQSFYAKTAGNLDLLSLLTVQLALAASIDWNNKVSIHVDGYGKVSIPIGDLEGVVGTTLAFGGQSMIKVNAYAKLGGELHVGKFTLAGVDAKANFHQAVLDFHVGPLHLGACLPTLNSFTSDYMLRMILSILGSIKNLPEALLNFFKHPNITLFAPFGSGDGDIVYMDDSGGKRGDEGNEQPNTPSTELPGDQSKGQPGGPSTGQPGGPSTGQPGGPSTGPGDPSTGQPGDPSTGQLGGPSTGQPGGPSKVKPNNPVKEQNNKPIKVVLISVPEMKNVVKLSEAGKERLQRIGINTKHTSFDKGGNEAGGKKDGQEEDPVDGQGAVAAATGTGNGGNDPGTAGPKKETKKPVDQKPKEEPLFNCNCGNSDEGYQLATYDEIMKNIDHGYVVSKNANDKFEIISLKKQLEMQRFCEVKNFKDLLFLTFINNRKEDTQKDHTHAPLYYFTKEIADTRKTTAICSEEDHRLYKKDFVIYGYSKSTILLKDFNQFNFFPIVSPNIEKKDEPDRFALKLKSSNNSERGTEFKAINNPSISFISPDGSSPYYNFVLAYNDNDIYLLANSFSSEFNNYCVPGCDAVPVPFSELYKNSQYIKFPELSEEDLKIKYCFFKKKRNQLSEENNLVDISEIVTDPENIKKYSKQLSESKRLWVLEDKSGKPYFTIKPAAFSILQQNKNGAGNADKFDEYIGLTSKFETKLNKGIVLSILTDCNKTPGNFNNIKTRFDDIRNGSVEESKMVKLIKYLNKVVNGELIDITDYCDDIYLKDIDLHLTPFIEKSDNKWEGIFYTKQDNVAGMPVYLDENHLTHFFKITDKTEIKQVDFENNKLFTNFFEYYWTQGSSDEDKFKLIDYDEKQIAWIKANDEVNGQYSIVTLTDTSYNPNYRTWQIYLRDNKLAGVFEDGDFFNRTDVDEIHGLKDLMPSLITDTSKKIIIDYLYPEKPNSPLVIYMESQARVELWIEGRGHLKISRDRFISNINNATKRINYKNIKTDHSRIPAGVIKDDIISHCEFILDGLRGLKNWHATSNADINPLSLFNDNLIKNIK